MSNTTLIWAPKTASRRLQLSVSRLIQLDREGVLRALRDSEGRRFYLPEDVERFAQDRERKLRPRHDGAR